GGVPLGANGDALHQRVPVAPVAEGVAGQRLHLIVGDGPLHPERPAILLLDEVVGIPREALALSLRGGDLLLDAVRATPAAVRAVGHPATALALRPTHHRLLPLWGHGGHVGV